MVNDLTLFIEELRLHKIESDMTYKEDKKAAKGMKDPLQPYHIFTKHKDINEIRSLFDKTDFDFYDAREYMGKEDVAYTIIFTRSLK